MGGGEVLRRRGVRLRVGPRLLVILLGDCARPGAVFDPLSSADGFRLIAAVRGSRGNDISDQRRSLTTLAKKGDALLLAFRAAAMCQFSAHRVRAITAKQKAARQMPVLG